MSSRTARARRLSLLLRYIGLNAEVSCSGSGSLFIRTFKADPSPLSSLCQSLKCMCRRHFVLSALSSGSGHCARASTSFFVSQDCWQLGKYDWLYGSIMRGNANPEIMECPKWNFSLIVTLLFSVPHLLSSRLRCPLLCRWAHRLSRRAAKGTISTLFADLLKHCRCRLLCLSQRREKRQFCSSTGLQPPPPTCQSLAPSRSVSSVVARPT